MPTNLPSGIFRFTKVAVARGQLKTAIRLWFHDGDPVSTHTLAYAAYEIIHSVSKKYRTKQLIFDTLSVKKEYRYKWAKIVKEHANFFKHAKNDAEESIDFNPIFTMMFLIGASAGLRTIDNGLAGKEVPAGKEETAFMFWVALHRPTWATAKVSSILQNRVPVEDLLYFQTLPKAQFFDAFMSANHSGRE